MSEHLTVRGTLATIAALAVVACGSSPPTAEHASHAEHHEHHDHAEHAEHAGHEGHGDAPNPHAHHEAMAKKQELIRTEERYSLPEVSLIDQSGDAFALQKLSASERPVALNFIFTTCTTICPVMTATFARSRALLGDDADKVHMVSVSIDPQKDTPPVLREYAGKFDAPDDWTFLTGEPADVLKVLEAFDADFTTKFEHEPLTLLHRPGAGDEWVRLEGLGNAELLTAQVRTVIPGS